MSFRRCDDGEGKIGGAGHEPLEVDAHLKAPQTRL